MSTEDTSEAPEHYCLDDRDRAVVATAIQLLQKILRPDFIAPAEIVSVAKVLHVLKRLPNHSAIIEVFVGLSGPRRMFDEHEIYHFWQVNVYAGEIEILSGGHFYRQSTGGDTFTCMRWSAVPGVEADYSDYLDQLHMVDDTQPFDKEIAELDLTQPGYALEVTDENNPILGEDSETDETVESAQSESGQTGCTSGELRLLALIDETEGRRREEFYLNPSHSCGICGCDLYARRFFVDGRLRGQIMCASLCAECFLEKGEGIGWGRGQIYQREPDGGWLLVAGFRPKQKR